MGLIAVRSFQMCCNHFYFIQHVHKKKIMHIDVVIVVTFSSWFNYMRHYRGIPKL